MKPETSRYDGPAEGSGDREGGDDALTQSSPDDARLDEKVIVNEQRSDQAVNTADDAEQPEEM